MRDEKRKSESGDNERARKGMEQKAKGMMEVGEEGGREDDKGRMGKREGGCGRMTLMKCFSAANM